MNSWEGGCEEGVTVVLNLEGITDNFGLLKYLPITNMLMTHVMQNGKGRINYNLKNK